ncbi:MAG: DNA mismatch repair endonuclease MutL [Planctomycetota bacterium]|nr:MAG: DNA mismatch repair endonuclease MutL [Planctomycetota bacterium]
MGRIHTLPMSVVNRIAAGEVVERPASVVKELLENALDSGPTRIDVSLEQGGVGLVRVVDDGGGIDADDLPLAVSPHATSKLRVAEDLEHIGTLGFRGEALASIAEVARVVIRSRTAVAPHGARLEVDAGRMGEVVPEGCSVGTTVEVHQLFSKVPARRAFLRSPSTEWSHASEAFVRTALAHPAVALSLEHNGRKIHDLPTADRWRTRIGDLFGTSLAERLVEVEASDDGIAVHGLVGRPEDDVAGTRLQHLFVSGRPFRDRSILHAVAEGYRGVLLSGRQPIVFLRFELSPELVDVNVHPAKMEVRFREPSRLYRLVLSALRTKFLTSDLRAAFSPPVATDAPSLGPASAWMPAARQLSPLPWAGSPAVAPWKPFATPSTAAPRRLPGWEEEGAEALSAAGASSSGEISGRLDQAAGEERAVQMHDRYLVVETRDGIEVIDQHALHERVLYEDLKAALAAGSVEVQRLLIPERLELSPSELEIVTDHAESLSRAGLRIEPFGGSTVIVTAKPVLAGKTAAVDLVRGVIDRIAALSVPQPGMLVDEVLHGMSCQAAIKAGDRLSQAEIDALVRERHRVTDAHHCPHGRPTSLTLSRQELDRQFRRT